MGKNYVTYLLCNFIHEATVTTADNIVILHYTAYGYLVAERARPYLRTFDLNEDSDFINAIYVNGYSGHNQFILGQWPVRSSINDFWRLVLDDHIAVTIVLHDAQSSRRNFPTFWPTAHCTSARYGPVRVTAVRNTDTSEYTIKTFSIRKYVWNPAESFLSKDCFIMQLIFLKSWPENDDLPKNWTSLVNLIDLTQKWTQKNGKAVRPAFIMSKDGIHRAGLYCSLSLCVEQLSKDGEVDVFNAVRNVKYNRPDLVNKVEFECLYSIVTKHIMHKYLAVADESSMISQGLQATAKEEFEMLQYMASVYGINSSRSQIHNAPLSR
ncbi:hypothetical protein EB796_002825 [Bugula neritina]|uniref:Uncharacterized protein n=1 Tax=Bugula neritina TaxID=10212 RepID=A0A7J7KLD4_BUGNE|nr:hypothetical protein EB796_002825 [Bugula neritina]